MLSPFGLNAGARPYAIDAALVVLLEAWGVDTADSEVRVEPRLRAVRGVGASSA